MAEAEKEKAIAAKTRAESDKLEFARIVRKFASLVMLAGVVDAPAIQAQPDRVGDQVEVELDLV